MRTLRFAKNPIPILGSNFDQYGSTYQFHIGGVQKGIATQDPEIIQHILQKNNRNYKKSNIQSGILRRYVGKGLLTSEGKYWLRQRRLIQPGFHRERLQGLVHQMNTMISAYYEEWAGAEEVDISAGMHDLAFAIVAGSLFGTSVDRDTTLTLRKNLTDLQNFIITQVRQPYLLPWLQLSGAMRKNLRLADATKNIIRGIITERRQKSESANDLLQMLLDARYEDTGEGMDDEQLLDESLIIFVAGHETSANALTWIFYLLSQHPEVMDKLQQEVDAVLEDRAPTIGELPRLGYVRQVVEEAMRLYPPAWVLDRVALKEDQVAGYRIPADTMLILYTYGVHHDSKHWEDPERFDPDRFAAENKKNHAPYTYLPFGGGPRLCIGNNFALMEMQLILVHFVQRFSFFAPAEELDIKPLITLRPDHALRLKVVQRKRAVQEVPNSSL